MTMGLAPRGLTLGETTAADLERMLANNGELSPFPDRPPRPISADYPSADFPDGPPTDTSTGRLTQDIEGRPLTAPKIVGRTTPGGIDQPLAPGDYDALAKSLNAEIRTVPARDLGGNLGGTMIRTEKTPMRDPFGHPMLDENGNPLFEPGYLPMLDENGRLQFDIHLSDALTPEEAEITRAHELGHLMSHWAGEPVPGESYWQNIHIPYAAAAAEAEAVANTGRGWQGGSYSYGLQSNFRYPPSDVPFEITAENMRAYLANPNYLKTVAPGVAKLIRDAWNANPELRKILQFNSIVAGATAANAARRPSYQLLPVDNDPFQ